MFRWALSLLLPFALATAAIRAQTTYGMPVDIPHNRPTPTDRTPVGGLLTPDGRVLIYGDQVLFPGTHSNGGWFARVLRHESVTLSASGVPQLTASSWSPEVKFADDSLPLTFPGGSASFTTGFHAWICGGPDPAYADKPVPFRSDINGNYSPQGTYATYQLRVVAPLWWPIDSSSPLTLTNPQFGSSLGTSHIYFVMATRSLQIVVSAPRTTNASIHSISLLAAPTPLTYASGATQLPILGVEPSITMDGRLLVFNGQNDAATTPPRAIRNRVLYSYNQTPFAPTGWSAPRMLNEMHSTDAASIVAGRRFDDRYPIAKQPLRDGLNELVTGEYWGAYPWITLDGTDIVHTTLTLPVVGVRSGLSIIGQSTGWKLQHIDGPLNMNRTTERLVFAGTGISPGIWSPARDMRTPPLPYARHGHSFPLLGIDKNSAIYGEASVEDWLDSDCMVSLPMNEAVTADPAGQTCWERQLQKTPDLSSHPDRFTESQVGLLEYGAAFPPDIYSTDHNYGAIGQAISFADASRVRVPTFNTPTRMGKATITVEFFVNDPSIRSTPIGNPRFHLFAQHPGAWMVLGDENGSFAWAVLTAGGLRVSNPLPGIVANTWTHLAMTFHSSPTTDTMKLYVGGKLVATTTFPGNGATGILNATGDLILGPNNEHVAICGPFNSRFMLDEFKFSQVLRTDEEIARHARATLPPASWQQSPPLPLGLDDSATRISPSHPFTADTVNLGLALFHDPGLSRSGSISCASCHQASLDFTDGQVLAIGNMGQALLRNTPTVLNRIFSTAQLFDGQAQSLEEQALFPINHPDELNSSTADAVAYLQSIPAYVGAFQIAYGSPPSAKNLTQALASYQRAIVSGDSPFDRHAAGVTSLTGAALRGHDLFFGKARCFSCHHGTNFSDESFHITVVNDVDTGRFAVTNRTFDRHRFKTPTLRNVANTAPYFHNGSGSTLADVVQLYNVGGARTVPDTEIRPLELSPTEQSDLVAFLGALTGTVTLLQP